MRFKLTSSQHRFSSDTAIMKPKKLLPLAAMSGLLLTAAPAHAAAVLLLSDDFNSGDNTNLNESSAILAARQDGTLESTASVTPPAGSTWTELVQSTNAILSNQLNVPNSGHVRNNADFEAALTSVDLVAVSGFIMAFKMDYTGTGGAWTSPYLSTHAGDERGNSRFGMVAFGSGDIQFYGGAFGGAQVPTGLSNAAIATLIPGWNITNQNSYSFIATRTTATTGVYDVFINGVEVASNIAYAFGGGGDGTGAVGEVNFEIINITGGAGLYDDFSVTTIPEPSAALLGGLGLLALLHRRR